MSHFVTQSSFEVTHFVTGGKYSDVRKIHTKRQNGYIFSEVDIVDGTIGRNARSAVYSANLLSLIVNDKEPNGTLIIAGPIHDATQT